MIRPVELYIGLRYTRARRRNHFISFITVLSILGISVGVWALITVLSIMNGFEKELKERILSAASHVTVAAADGTLEDWRGMIDPLSARPGVEATAPFILGQGMLSANRRVGGVLVRGITPELEPQVSDILNELEQGAIGDLEAGAFNIIIGRELAAKLGARQGSKITMVIPSGHTTPAGLLPRIRRFTISGIFHLGMYEYDSTLVFIHLDDAARLFRSGAGVSGLRLRLADLDAAPQLRVTLGAELGRGFRVRDWSQEHRNFFRALKVERRVMFIILTLIVAVAAFNIVSTLVMVVTDKRSDIAILKTLGLTPGGALVIFMVQGLITGILGTLIGGVCGVLSALNVDTVVPFLEGLLATEFFPADIYVISKFPGELRWLDVRKVIGASLVLSFFATIYPAWRAARIHPAETLRYE